jgi:hypothetical protein
LSVPVSDEVGFDTDIITKYYNHHQWAEDSPHVVLQSIRQQQFSINIWAGSVRDCLVGPHVYPRQLTHDSLLNGLPSLPEDLPLEIRECIWFMLDGAPKYFSYVVLNNIDHN